MAKHVDRRPAVKVCTEVHGPKPGPEYMCLHKDDNPYNNDPDNLYWGTRSDNMRDSWSNGCRTHAAIGPSHPRAGAKLSEDDVRKIRADYAAGKWTQAELADIYDVKVTAISRLINRRTWSHIE